MNFCFKVKFLTISIQNVPIIDINKIIIHRFILKEVIFNMGLKKTIEVTIMTVIKAASIQTIINELEKNPTFIKGSRSVLIFIPRKT